jgi:HAD superfamily hydrolase (TIGR01509 family)
MDFLRALIDSYGLPQSPENVYSKHKRHLVELYRKQVELMTGVVDLVNGFQRMGIGLALASSSGHDLIEVVLKKFELESFFKIVVSGEDVERSKPNPGIFTKAARKLGIPASECLAIEDSSAGVQAALAAGMMCVGFRSPHSPNQDLTGADLITDDLTALQADTLVHLIRKE